MESIYTYNTVIIGSGAAGYNTADSLFRLGMKDIAIVTENRLWGTSRNAGSDKQTYYRVASTGYQDDGALKMAKSLYAGLATDGDNAFCEAALSSQGFFKLVELGVPFPRDAYGRYIGYQTDHDTCSRGSSAGPYTSKMMTEALERAVKQDGIKMHDHMLAVKLVVDHNRNQVVGLVCLDLRALHRGRISLKTFHAKNVVFACGGPGGIYRDSVFPASQFGGSGVALKEGVKGQNLTEWQFGLASVKPRWNVSGSYMQVLPRIYSTDKNDSDEREFLSDAIPDLYELLGKEFLKGYQWPFDVRKVASGSSLIDALVFLEIKKGRKVYLDYRSNPLGLSELNYQKLPKEALKYLTDTGICFGTPYDRLEKLNHPAITYYLDHGVDLRHEPLQIALCAQHNNGGLAVDAWWRTNVKGVFAVGEASGTHGVYRPGGSALNETQVGSLRVAEYIVVRRKGKPRSPEVLLAKARKEEEAFCKQLLGNTAGEAVSSIHNRLTKLMSISGSAFRKEDTMEESCFEIKNVLDAFTSAAKAETPKDLEDAYRTRCIAFTQYIYLSAFIDYARQNGKSRGSALYYQGNGKILNPLLPEEMRCILDDEKVNQIQEIQYDDRTVRITWRNPRPIPEETGVFEQIWSQYRKDWNVGK